jgi:lysophospholipase L1-like esterase
MPRIVLLGDSILDNRAYVQSNEPDVVTQLGALLPPGSHATLCAVDGSVTVDIVRQLARVPADATHLVVSSGGNDALANIDILGAPARSSADTLARLADMAEAFAADYRAMLHQVMKRTLPVAVCTIYDGNFPDRIIQRLASTALTVYNDVILRLAARARIPVLDLRAVCDEPADYANPIEPSAIGGAKIAAAVEHVVRTHDFTSRRTIVYAG